MKKVVFRYSNGEISTLIVVTFLALIGAAALVTTTLNQEIQDRRSEASEVCSFESNETIQFTQTETDSENSENRVPISSNRYYYDSIGDQNNLIQITDQSILNLTADPAGPTDTNIQGIMGKMFGYKPTILSAAYKLRIPAPYQGGEEGGPSGAHVLAVPTNPNNPNSEIKMPSVGSYNIGGDYVAMVTFAAADRITLRIGNSEYFTGVKTCRNGETCSGGYWIYIKNICVDKKILNAYNSVKEIQERAGADLNPISLPKVRANQVVGKAIGDNVLVGVRDNGQFITLYRPFYWSGVNTIDTNLQPTLSTVLTPTITPNPASTPTPTPSISAETPAPQPTITTSTPSNNSISGLMTQDVSISAPIIVCPNGTPIIVNAAVIDKNELCLEII